MVRQAAPLTGYRHRIRAPRRPSLKQLWQQYRRHWRRGVIPFGQDLPPLTLIQDLYLAQRSSGCALQCGDQVRGRSMQQRAYLLWGGRRDRIGSEDEAGTGVVDGDGQRIVGVLPAVEHLDAIEADAALRAVAVVENRSKQR